MEMPSKNHSNEALETPGRESSKEQMKSYLTNPSRYPGQKDRDRRDGPGGN